MSLDAISSRVIAAVHARLSDATTGFNPRIITNALAYGLPSNFIAINWNAETSDNFIFGQVDPALIESTGILTYPFANLYTKESGHTGDQRFTQFSGLIRCVLEIHLSWVPIKGMKNFEKYGDCVEDVVYDVINRVENQNWGKPLVYNGQIQAKRLPVTFGGNNFRQDIGFAMMFGLHQ